VKDKVCVTSEFIT